MYHIVICDDDKLFVNYLKKMILFGGLKLEEVTFYEYYSGEEFIKNLKANRAYDLLIVDMQMKLMDGNETAKRFRQEFPTTTLVFCSGVCQPTVKSFETTPFRYLLKEYTDSHMLTEIRIIISQIKNKKTEPYIIGSYHYSSVKLKPDEILYIAVAKRGSTIFVCPHVIQYDFEKYLSSREKVEDLYDVLKDFGFVYAHNSYIVNLKHIKKKTTTELELVDGTILTIARSKEKALRIALAEKLAKKY